MALFNTTSNNPANHQIEPTPDELMEFQSREVDGKRRLLNCKACYIYFESFIESQRLSGTQLFHYSILFIGF